MEQNKVIETEIIGLEQKFWDALKRKDVKTMESLSDETCVLAGPQGASKFKRADFANMLNQQRYEIVDFKFKDNWQVEILNSQTAVIAYNVEENLTVDGKPLTLSAAESSTWTKKDGKWVCSLHTESILGDPFGRDRNRVN